MPSFISTELLKHKFVVAASAATAIIIAGSAAYYVLATRPPTVMAGNGATAPAGAVTASGVVEPVQNPDLSFGASGRVASVAATVGGRVAAGQVLAALDTASLSASRAAALAGQASLQARLDALKAGPRDTDIAVKQSAVNQAGQTLAALYASLPATMSDAVGSASDALANADPLFSSPHSSSPVILFSVTNSSLAQALQSARLSAGNELSLWQSEVASLSAAPAQSDVDAALAHALGHLAAVRAFEDALTAALGNAIPTQSFNASQIAAALAAASAERSTIAGLVISLTGDQQSLVTDALAVSSAQISLDQLKAGASAEDIAAAQASVDAAAANVASIDADIRDRLVIAPFSGTVASVAVKSGEVVQPDALAVTLLPDAALEVTVYVTEIDVAHLAIGTPASVTLDAYGAGRVFPATVSSVDQAPSATQSGYKVTLAFTAPSSDIKAGMTANATITPAQH